MVLDADILQYSKSFDFLGKTAAALFSTKKPKESLIDRSVAQSEDIISSLVGTLEKLDQSGEELSEEQLDNLLEPFTLGLEMSRPILFSIKGILADTDIEHSDLYYKYNSLLSKFIEISETMEKIVVKLKDLKESIVCDDLLGMSINSSGDLWSEEDDSELKSLFSEI